jgi:hypothetical protein
MSRPHRAGTIGTNEALDHFAPQLRQGRRRHAPQKIVERVGVGYLLLFTVGQGVQIGQCLGGVQLETQPPSRAELEQEAHQAHPQQEPPPVGDQVLVAFVADFPEPVEQVGKEMGDGLGQGRAQF